MDIQNQIITPIENGENPNFDQEVAEILAILGVGVSYLITELEKINLINVDQIDADEFIARLDRAMTETIEKLDEKADEIVPFFIQAGIGAYLFTQGMSYTQEAIENILKGELHQYTIAKVSTNMKNAFRGIARTIRTRTQGSLQDAVTRSVRNRYARRVFTLEETQRLTDELKKAVKESIGSGYIDRAGRRWKPETYADVVAKTAAMDAFRETIMNEGIANGQMYAVVMGPPAKDECNSWRGKIVKLVETAPGPYTTYDALRESKACFHPNCRHYLRATENPEEV